MKRILIWLVLFGGPLISAGQYKNDRLLEDILASNDDSLYREVLRNPDKYRYQIIYTQINRDNRNEPHFTDYYFQVDPARYYYPASVVKMPLAFLSLEKLHQMKKRNINKDTPLLFDSAFAYQAPMRADSTAEDYLPSIAQFIRKAFLVSDNDAYNRMYQFMGQQAINERLHEKGYKDIRITRQFRRITPEQNRHTNPFHFIDRNGRTLFQDPGAFNTDSFDFDKPFLLGQAYYNWQDSLVEGPLDFTTHNYMPLTDLQELLQSVLFPESVSKSRRFDLGRDDYRFLYQYLSQYPGETNFPKYDPEEYYETYVKFFFKGPNKNMPEGVRVFNKVGWAYGCLTDVSYVADFTHKVEFMLTATIYVNEDGILNDDKYEYEEVGLPFLYQLGQTIYRFELKRPRAYVPNLSRFEIKYENRETNERPLIRNVDN